MINTMKGDFFFKKESPIIFHLMHKTIRLGMKRTNNGWLYAFIHSKCLTTMSAGNSGTHMTNMIFQVDYCIM